MGFFDSLFKRKKDDSYDRDYKGNARGKKKAESTEQESGSGGMGLDELAKRLGLSAAEMKAVEVRYQQYKIPKKSGGHRNIFAPDPALKKLQKRILKRLLARLKTHHCATGFEKKKSIVDNAKAHVGCAVLVKMDIKEFFPSTTAKRVKDYFRAIGWNKEAVEFLAKICAHNDGLPQGAPTSPRLSNLVNYSIDEQLAIMAKKKRAVYTRYADDITLSFKDGKIRLNSVIGGVKETLKRFGYTLHQKRKLQVRRKHQQQRVTGLVINEELNLPRKTRRWLRAVEHRISQGKTATITEAQLEGWKSYATMIYRRR